MALGDGQDARRRPVKPMRRVLRATIVPSLVVLGLLWGAAPSNAVTTYQVPTNIRDNCSADVTQALLSWIGTVPDNSIVSFGLGACYRIDGTLELWDRNGLDLEGNGATFEATSAPASGDERAQWRFVGGSNLTMRNMVVKGVDATGAFVYAYQHEPAIDLRGPNGIDIGGVTGLETYGDCLYVGQDWRNAAWSRNVHVHNSTCLRNGRMGIAITAGRDVRVDTSSFDQTGLSTFDIEPNGAGFGAANVTFTQNQILRVYDYAFVAVGSGPVDGVAVTNNLLAGSPLHMAVLAPTGQRRSNITITGNVTDTGYYDGNGEAMEFRGIDGLTVTGNTALLVGPNMALASVAESCSVNVTGNSFIAGVIEARVSPYSGCSSPDSTPAPPPANLAPTVHLTAPADGAAFTTSLPMSASATDDHGVARVEFWANGKLLATDSSAPYAYTWNFKRKGSYGSYTITARAFDAAGLSDSDSVMVTRLSSTSTTLRLAKARRKFRAVGRVRGSRSGRIALRLERFDRRAHRWHKAGTVRVRIRAQGKFVARLRGLKHGRWRAKARFLGGGQMASSASSYRYLVVS
jgi:Bacterial Ig domain